ncbi:hypothetical protein BABINDRAFT_161022 [Babjeviella inositovora NRRL Y-12698]|uniref:Protein YIP n=1 Tax=Babjeviella inositovora NRRL Y-12698 TaxID=984486 RepID=A0A1E3QT49_9ASCO|nr:uncharacterized protein BABINDRAFT_161022 [Babjeviella inositovora NRRL Y-12698]ODQ80818.1 hypothetical protein BABINDRAFT_161022 [Babjeviella inositovora NRRL Y-12698]
MAYFQQQSYGNNQPQFYAASNANANTYNPQQFQASAPVSGFMNNQFASPSADVTGNMSGQLLSQGVFAAFGTSGYPGESPLLEELGINFQHIKTKTLAVLNPFTSYAKFAVSSTGESDNGADNVMNDADLAGPILFVLMFGSFLLMAGKVQFGYVYGVGLFGTISLHYLFKLMGDNPGMDVLRSCSVIGYCLLPLVLLSLAGVFVNLDCFFGYIAGALSVLWCTLAASGFFQSVLRVNGVRALIGYPLMMFYSVFALMVIFVEVN